jgi:hypothetical protein
MNCWLPIIAALVGFFGDLLIQVFLKFTKYDWGLKSYFRKHGVIESACIASGILALFFSIWTIFNFPIRWEPILISALILDAFWNYFHVMPSLNNYYKEPIIPRTILGVIIPFLLPVFIVKFPHL